MICKNVVQTVVVWVGLWSFTSVTALAPEARAKGFVYLHEIDAMIKTSLRYAGNENFTATVVDGYKEAVVIMTRQAAQALKNVQDDLKKDGYCLVVYDAYRPQRAVDHFMRWSKDADDQAKKAYYYPRVDKARVFELGYVAARSGHSRGSTVDITLIKNGESVHGVIPRERTLLDGFVMTYLDDGTLDMGSSFDLFDVVSHYENDLITQEYKERRAYLRRVMERHGFKHYSEEWWHFTLRDEPFPAHDPASYSNFLVE